MNDNLVGVTLFNITRLINLLNLSRLFIKNLYVIFLYLLSFIFLKIIFSHKFINYKTHFALFNVVKIKKFECIYINIYLIEIC